MAMHTWLTKPTAVKAARLEVAYNYAIGQGATPHNAEVFAGYYTERRAQGGYEGSIANTYASLKPDRMANASNYRQCYQQHTTLFVGDQLPMLWDLLQLEGEEAITHYGDLGKVAATVKATSYELWRLGVLATLARCDLGELQRNDVLTCICGGQGTERRGWAHCSQCGQRWPVGLGYK